ncbi:MAG: SRPBCC family protein [Acidimicrobiales bacterium]
MELTNDFEVAVSVDEAWKVLTDVERIAPCMPGAQLQEVEGDEYRGIVKVKVGPITASYKGAASFLELDQEAHRAVLKAEGRETRGQGNASATITATLVDTGAGSTKVSVVTDLNITGKVAQFGRGVLADVSGKLLEQFVSNLETTVLAPAAAGGLAPDAGAAAGAAEASTEAVAPPAPPRARATRSRKAAAAKPAAAGAQPVGDAAAPEAGAASEPAGAGEQAAAAESSAPEPEPVAEAEPRIRRVDHAEPEPVDLVGVAGPSLRKRILPYASIAGAIFLLRIVIYALRRRKK